MKSQLKRIEIKAVFADDHDFTIEDAAFRKLRLQHFDELGEITIERLLIAALDEDVVAITEYQRTKSIPLGSKIQSSPGGSSSMRFASIGLTGGFTGRFMSASCRCRHH